MTNKDVIGHLIVRMPGRCSGIVARNCSFLATLFQRAGIGNTTSRIESGTMDAAIGLAA
jgi:hypothetical protein